MLFHKVQIQQSVTQDSKHGVEGHGIRSAKTWTTSRTQVSQPVRPFTIFYEPHSTHFATPVWISPVSQNYEGPRSTYGDAYHGYWIADATKLNDRFGTADDLKALSDELHRRGMYVTFLETRRHTGPS